MTHHPDLLCLGNAIVDVLTPVDDAFLTDRQMAKGGMSLVDEAQAEALHAAMRSDIVVSGGSAANTAVGARRLGATASGGARGIDVFRGCLA